VIEGFTKETGFAYMNLTDARDKWLRVLRSEGKSKATLDIYSSAVDRFVEYQRDHHGPTDVSKITRENIQGFLTHLQDTKSQATAHNRYRALRALFNWLSDGTDELRVRREPLAVLDRSPMRRMAPPKLEEVPVPLLPPDQVEDLWSLTERPGKDFTRRRDAAIIRLFLATGIRAGEMARLTMENLDLDRQLAYVKGKGRKSRKVPFAGPVVVSVDRYLTVREQNKYASRSNFIWLGIKGPMTPSGMLQMVERFGKKAGIEGLHPHVLRHQFVDACFSKGMSESEVMELMGWSTAAMCRRYASARRAQRAIDTYHKLGIGDPYRDPAKTWDEGRIRRVKSG
jgi:site-specific recombinase XerD